MVAFLTLVAATTPSFVYWQDPRIHSLGNGVVHASFARVATTVIDYLSYGGRPIRKQVLAQYVPRSHTVIDLCCGTGTSTRYDAIGVDTSAPMLTEARWRRGPLGMFVLGNAETYGDTNECDTVTIFFSLHEQPRDARMRVITNALRLARKQVVCCDISPNKSPSRATLSGEPYLLEYQRNILEDLDNLAVHTTVDVDEFVPGRVIVATLRH